MTDDEIYAINAALLSALDPDNEGWADSAVEAFGAMRTLGLGLRALHPLERGEGPSTDGNPPGYRDAHQGPDRPGDADTTPQGVVMTFGKHSGRTLGEIQDLDPQYLVWLLHKHREGGTRPAEIGQAVQEILGS